MEEIERWYNLEEIANHLGVSKDTIRSYIKKGTITEHIACRTVNISAVRRISILRWIRLAITVFVRIPECRSWD